MLVFLPPMKEHEDGRRVFQLKLCLHAKYNVNSFLRFGIFYWPLCSFSCLLEGTYTSPRAKILLLFYPHLASRSYSYGYVLQVVETAENILSLCPNSEVPCASVHTAVSIFCREKLSLYIGTTYSIIIIIILLLF
jgi:hypothetical protein